MPYDPARVRQARQRLADLGVFARVDEPTLEALGGGRARLAFPVVEAATNPFDGALGFQSASTAAGGARRRPDGPLRPGAGQPRGHGAPGGDPLRGSRGRRHRVPPALRRAADVRPRHAHRAGARPAGRGHALHAHARRAAPVVGGVAGRPPVARVRARAHGARRGHGRARDGRHVRGRHRGRPPRRSAGAARRLPHGAGDRHRLQARGAAPRRGTARHAAHRLAAQRGASPGRRVQRRAARRRRRAAPVERAGRAVLRSRRDGRRAPAARLSRGRVPRLALGGRARRVRRVPGHGRTGRSRSSTRACSTGRSSTPTACPRPRRCCGRAPASGSRPRPGSAWSRCPWAGGRATGRSKASCTCGSSTASSYPPLPKARPMSEVPKTRAAYDRLRRAIERHDRLYYVEAQARDLRPRVRRAVRRAGRGRARASRVGRSRPRPTQRVSETPLGRLPHGAPQRADAVARQQLQPTRTSREFDARVAQGARDRGRRLRRRAQDRRRGGRAALRGRRVRRAASRAATASRATT